MIVMSLNLCYVLVGTGAGDRSRGQSPSYRYGTGIRRAARSNGLLQRGVAKCVDFFSHHQRQFKIIIILSLSFPVLGVSSRR
jgi:hypothetical protein